MSDKTMQPYHPAGLPIPVPEADGLSAPFWNGLREERVRIQHCAHCGTWQHGPEWLCHRCHTFDPALEDVAPEGRVYSWERVWHPVHPCLKDRGPYLVVLVELPQAGGVRLLGNLLGDPMQEIPIGALVRGVFEHHLDARLSFTLLQWQLMK